jgi:hypothetical protein
MLSITRFSFYKIVIYEMSARRHFSHMSALFEARATKERVLHLRECAEYVFSHRSSYNFLKRTLCLICCIPFMDRIALVHAIAKVSIELIAIYFHSFEIFVIQIGEMSFWMILKH